MKIYSPQHPIWLAGFRPFFILLALSGILLPLIWILIFSGEILLPQSVHSLQWHAHEMLYGFGGAVLIGFLLTATKNWVDVRGIYGSQLMILVILWLAERFYFFVLPQEPVILRHIFFSLFFFLSGTYILNTLFNHRQKDSSKDNFLFYFVLILLLIAKNLVLNDLYYTLGISMSIGLFRLAFAIMLERTMTQFMKVTESIALFRKPSLDHGIKFLMLASVFESFFSSPWAAGLLLLTGTLFLLRLLLWRPDRGFRTFGNATMYIGSAALGLSLVFLGLQKLGLPMGYGSTAIHTFTFLCMGTVIASMFVRISKGHTGRKVEFSTMDIFAISLLLIASVFRLFLPSYDPEHYRLWIAISGSLWSMAFLILSLRLIVFLLRPRIDGKVH